MKLILASNSPRRKDILTKEGLDFVVIKSGYEEKTDFTSPKKIVKTFAFNKAKDVFDKQENKDVLVLGADTVVYFKGKVLGKPKSLEEATLMLKSLSGKMHCVYTGFALISKEKIKRGCVKTKVYFNRLSEDFIKEYVSTGSPLDKAGAYGIQDSDKFVKKYSGSYSNIVGLPIEKIKPLITEMTGDKL